MSLPTPELIAPAPGALRWAHAPRGQAAGPLFVLLHGPDGHAAQMAPVAARLLTEFPAAAVWALDAPLAAAAVHRVAGEGQPCWCWIEPPGASDAEHAARVGAALPALAQRLQAAQASEGIAPEATALLGFSQGATLALALAFARDGLVGRVLAIGGVAAGWQAPAPARTTLHLAHGEDDVVVPAASVRAALAQLTAWQADATADLAQGVGHELHPALLDACVYRLRHHIPARTWAEALGGAAAGARRPSGDEDDDRED